MDFGSNKDTGHRLQNKWSLWYFRMLRGVDWTKCNNFVASVDTIEEFWNLIAYVDAPSRISSNCNYSFFKYGIEPTWEDVDNQDGGRMFAGLDKKMSATQLDSLWVEVLMAIVGDEFGELTDEICGVVLDIKPRGNRLSIWTKFKDSSANKVIEELFRKVINLPNVSICYQSHADANKK